MLEHGEATADPSMTRPLAWNVRRQALRQASTRS